MGKEYEEIDFLIIEDDLDTNTFLNEFFKTQGYNCKSARNIKDALELLKNNIPSIILLDILLPDKKGYEIITFIKSNPLLNNVLIYFLTAVPIHDAIRKVEEYNIEGAIGKPFNLEELKLLFKNLRKKRR
ncbi:MAG: two-component system response regulator [Candidatus Hodarchaeota archaeon]